MMNRQSKSFIRSSLVKTQKQQGRISMVIVLWVAVLGAVVFMLMVSTMMISNANDVSNNSNRPGDTTFIRGFSSLSSSSLANKPKQQYAKSAPKEEQQQDQNQQREYHMVFSTSCDPFQNWQSIAFFYFAHRAKQPGHITRIVSGCTPEKAQALQKVHDEQIAPLNPLYYHLHITPDFGHGPGDQKYWNKPYGLLNYMESHLGYSKTTSSTAHDNDVIIILDPDMMLLKPITDDFSDYVGLWKNELTHTKVEHGKPIAQRYEYGAQWITSLKGKVADVVGPNSPVLQLNLTQADLYYPAGPPYLATAKDMYQIVTYWVQFLPHIFAIFPEFMAEMHGYSTAAAHLKLPHRLARGFMISTVGNFENFDFVDTSLNRTTACEVAAHGVSDQVVGSSGRRLPPSIPQLQTQKLPYVLHYCQRYALGRYFFSKYKLNEEFFECDAPLMKEPPLNVGDVYDWFIFPNGVETSDMSSPSKHMDIVRNGWMMCSLIYGLNDAATKVKTKHCDHPNLEKTWHFHTEENFQQALDDPSNPFQKKK